jgi:hypothetical protein
LKNTRIILILLVFVISNAFAQEIYKSIDEDGNVSYSGLPPIEGESVSTLGSEPEPSSDDTEAAQKRVQELENATNISGQEDIQAISRQQMDADNVVIGTSSEAVPVRVPTIRKSNHGPNARRDHRR